MKNNQKFNYKLYFSVLLLSLCPTLYTTFRIFLLGQLPGDYSYSIAGQLAWVNLLYEILHEAIILPLFFFMGKARTDKEFENRIRSGLLISSLIYMVFSIIIIIFVRPLLTFMAVSPDIMEQSVQYIRIESIANIFSLMYQFVLIALITIGKTKNVYILNISNLILNLITDTFFVSTLPLSLTLGINGIGFSNILVNLILFIIAGYLLSRNNCNLLSTQKLDFKWISEFFKVGSISGLESFVRNIVYLLMISRMVNAVSEQGTYWVANNFIWGWLLLPVVTLAEIIKRDVAGNNKDLKHYFKITVIISVIWLASIPGWKPFLKNIMGVQDYEKVFNLVLVLLVFYIFYAFQNIFDSVFYGSGKTEYMLAESIGTNLIYYGAVFVLYKTGLWTPSLISIALMFGFGILFDSIVSFLAYLVFKRRELINRS